MAARRLLSRELLCAGSLPPATLARQTRCFTNCPPLLSESSTIPRVASPSVWHSLIPKAFRAPDDPVSRAERQKQKLNASKEWNPATFFIAIAMLIGSNAINMLALKNERLNFTRKTEAKIALLKETMERVQKGEDVDVEKVLGTGDPEKEKEWEQVMKEIEQDDALWQAKAKKRDQKASRDLSQETSKSTYAPAQPPSESSTAPPSDQKTGRPGFY